MKSVKVWIFIAVLLFYVTGVLSGILLERKIFRCRPPDWVFDKKDKRGKRLKEELLNKMAKDLSLNAKQKEEVKKIFNKYEPNFEKIRREFKDKFSLLHKEVEGKIIKVLTDEQKKKLEKIKRGKEGQLRKLDFRRRYKHKKFQWK